MPRVDGRHSQYVSFHVAAVGEYSRLEARIMNIRREVQKDANLILSTMVARLLGALALTADSLDDLFPDDPDPEMQNDIRTLVRAEESNMQSVRSLLRV